MIDPDRMRIQEDLRGIIQGDVRCDDVFLQLYASDASIYEIKPLGVVRPRNLDDVIALVRYANNRNISLHPRGSGSGLAGESLGSGIIVDMAHSMRRILQFDGESIRIQPGVVHQQLNKFLARHDRVFGPDPATSAVSTMGGAIALDGSGSHWLKYGSTRAYVEALQVVLADGTVLDVGPNKNIETLCAVPQVRGVLHKPQSRLDDIESRMKQLVIGHRDIIKEHTPSSLTHRCGYHLNGILKNEHFNLAKLFTGSEGSLGIITEATIRTSPLPGFRGLALLFFDRIEKAIEASRLAVNMGVSACDMIDRRLLALARATSSNLGKAIPSDAEVMLLVEMDAENSEDVRHRLRMIIDRIQHRENLAYTARTAVDEREVSQIWLLMKNVIPMLYRLEGSRRAIPFVEDISVHPEQLTTVVPELQTVLKQHQVTASLFGHVGHGQLHIRPLMDLRDSNDVRKLHGLANDLYEKVVDAGGTISGEHGAGLSRTWFMRKQFGPLYEVFAEVKRVFDPEFQLNPGKVVAELPQPIHNNLRPVNIEEAPATHMITPEPGERELVPLQLDWQESAVLYAARSCNGCARCRTTDQATRMCPVFRFNPVEESSPRAKANLMRSVLTGRLQPSELQEGDLKRVADLCINCHQCRIECPAGADIPKLMTEAKANHVHNNGLPFHELLLSRMDRTVQWASWLRWIYNWGVGNRYARWIASKLFRIAHGRKLPKLSSRSFMKWALRHRLHRPHQHSGRKVLYFVDLYANWFDVQLAKATVSVMQHNGISVYVPVNQKWAGMPAISEGDIDYARELISHNSALLSDAIRRGYHVITTEPSAAMALTREYPSVIDNEDTRLIAENTSDACSYLWEMHKSGELAHDLAPLDISAGYHLPCHLKALNQFTPAERILSLIPNLTIHRLDKGCSGMAGTFGLKQRNYRNSLRSGWGLISAMRAPDINIGTTECSTCKMQMEQGTTKPTIHPIKLLALSYGEMGEILQQLEKQGQELVVT